MAHAGILTSLVLPITFAVLNEFRLKVKTIQPFDNVCFAVLVEFMEQITSFRRNFTPCGVLKITSIQLENVTPHSQTMPALDRTVEECDESEAWSTEPSETGYDKMEESMASIPPMSVTAKNGAYGELQR